MDITCPRCQTRHQIDPPASARARAARSLKFRCSNCGHAFVVDARVIASPAAAPISRVRGSALPAPFVAQWVRVEGEAFPVADLATLQRWILERQRGVQDEETGRTRDLVDLADDHRTSTVIAHGQRPAGHG